MSPAWLFCSATELIRTDFIRMVFLAVGTWRFSLIPEHPSFPSCLVQDSEVAADANFTACSHFSVCSEYSKLVKNLQPYVARKKRIMSTVLLKTVIQSLLFPIDVI